MKHRILIYLLVVSLSGYLFLAACGNNEQSTSRDPLFTGADPLPTSEDQGMKIKVNADMLEGTVNPLAFGNSVMYRASSMGFSVGTSSQSDYDAAKAKWNSYLPLVRELGPTVLQYPGGLLSNSFGWKSGIGPVSQRDPSYEKSREGGKQIFGTDEFLQYCEEIDAQAILTVNVSVLGSTRPGSVQDAADWVEYCNAPSDGSNPGGGTDWAAVRAANGHKLPYGVKYWELGNEEIYPSWEDYARRVQEYSLAMKAIDPTIKIGAIRTGGGIQPFFEEVPNFIEYQKFMISEVGDYFDFWSHHTHIPGCSGYVDNGFGIVKEGADVEVRFDISQDGSYRFELPVSSDCSALNTNCPKLQLFIDGALKLDQTITSMPTTITTAPLDLTAGSHVLRLEGHNIEGQRAVYVCHQLELYRETGGVLRFMGLVDLKNDPKLYHMVVAASAEAARELEVGAPYTGGKPVYVTEVGFEYEQQMWPPLVNKVCDLREALGLASLYQLYLRKGIELINYWLLFEDDEATGVLEGVAWGQESGEEGRPDPHKRPSFHVLRAYRWNMFDELVNADIEGSPTFTEGPVTSGLILGFSSEETTTPYLQVLASESAIGDKFSLFVLNLDSNNSYEVPVQIQGFDPKPTATVFTITGNSPAANNEIKDCPSGDCVDTVASQISLQGNQFLYTFGQHSLTAFLFYRTGSDQMPPAAPQGLMGSVKEGMVLLHWNPDEESDLAGYVIYRSRVPKGPFGGRLTPEPIQGTAYQDVSVDNGVTYYYAIKAVDQSGNESPFSNKISLKP